MISDSQIAEITAIYSGFEEGQYSKIFDNADFGYRRITVNNESAWHSLQGFNLVVDLPRFEGRLAKY